jgi:NhaA family Na+:H+ antiporter
LTDDTPRNKLDRPVDGSRDHVLGPADAPITLVEYGSYACPHCRVANEEIAKLRDRFGDRMRYVFRQRPLAGSELARPAAELAECAAESGRFWSVHVELMTRSATLTDEDLRTVAAELGVHGTDAESAPRLARAAARVEEDEQSARASGVSFTPTFFINGRRYDGPWDETSLAEAMLGSLGHRVQSAALDFASWAPSAGVLLLLATLAAIGLTNSEVGPAFQAFWKQPAGLDFGGTGFRMTLLHWINDGLLALFFLVVGLEVKREFTTGRLANRRSAALPVAAAVGGLVVPAALYLAVIPSGPWLPGAGVPMPTDTAFAVALIVLLGRRVPVELRVFLTAAAIVDDIGTIGIVALAYSSELQPAWLAIAAGITATLWMLNRSAVYRPLPYVLLGIALWASVHAGGVHATLAGVILALLIPTRPPANLDALVAQAQAVIVAENRPGDSLLRHGPSLPALRMLDSIHDRLESPADRVLRTIEPWSSYFVLPLFALANAGVVMDAGVFEGRAELGFAIAIGLVLGKPIGFLLASLLAVRVGQAVKPDSYSWAQLTVAGALAGIGFTMSLFIATRAFPVEADFAAAKIAVLGASAVSALIGVTILGHAGRRASSRSGEEPS